MSDPEIVRANARVNAWSNTFMNLGSALVAADAYRVFVQVIADLVTALWTLGAALLIFTGLKVLGLLEADELP